MYNDIFTVLQKILQSLVKPDLLVNCKNFSDLLKLDLDSNDTFMKLKDMNIGFPTLSTVTKLRETDQISKNQISSFFNKVINFVTTIAKKLFEKSSMSHNVVRNSVIFDPLIACQENVGTLQSKLKKVLDHLIKHKLFQAQFCDKIMQQFLEFVGHDLKLLSDLFQSYKREKTSLDEFYFEKTDIRRFKELASLLNLTLSHGQAAVERGFSINNSLSIVNISEKSLLCKKLVKDHLLSNQQEAHTVPITNQLIRSAATARQKYKESLEKEK